ncbi:hypothetical protein QB607_003201 [Clostridium botulinum]|nr:hypothetical protein [Clostridium botulinum]EKS4395874.1 hypothetical protein [Clostridium botulinum]
MSNNITKYENDWDKIQEVKNNLFKDVRMDSITNLRNTAESEVVKVKIQNIINDIGNMMNSINDSLDDLQEELHDLEMKEYTKDWTAQEWAEYYLSCNNID